MFVQHFFCEKCCNILKNVINNHEVGWLKNDDQQV
jgi:hypothetical protein